MKSKKKRFIIIGVVVAVLAAAGIIFWIVKGGSASEETDASAVYVDSVANITGVGSGNGMITRFSGVVEPQKTWKIEVSSDKKVDEVYVKEGDEVKTGDKLFIYSTAEAEENLAQAEIELDRIANEIETGKQQLEDLKKEKANAPAEDQLEYTTRIQTAENAQKKSEYEQKSQKVQIEQLKKTIANAVVTSEMDGVVKSINNSDSSSADSYGMGGESEGFMTILATGNFRIKGTVNEQNISSVIEGQPVIVHSRVNEDQTWKGTMTSVDMENPEKNESAMYSASDSSEVSSNYPFYIELESVDGLMLGQHVYIEMDYGQEEKKDGLWLDSFYIIQEDEKAYVWAADSKDKMEKKEITLGEYDEDLMKYEILEGLTLEDYIAFPDASIAKGAAAEKNIAQMPMNSGDMEGGENLGSYDYGDEEDLGGEEDFDGGEDSGQGVAVPYGADDSNDMGVTMNEGAIGDGSAPVDAGMEEE